MHCWKNPHRARSSLTRRKVEKYVRKNYPSGIPSFPSDALRLHFRLARPICAHARNFALGRCGRLSNFSYRPIFVLMNTEGKDCGADASLPLAPSVWHLGIVSGCSARKKTRGRASTATASTSPRAVLPNLLGTNTATGIWNWPRCSCNRAAKPSSAPPGAPWCARWRRARRAAYPVIPFISLKSC